MRGTTSNSGEGTALRMKPRSAARAPRQQVQSLTSGRVKAGLDSKLELKQVETSIPAARARIAQTQEEIALARNQLAALLGQGPDRGLAIQRPALRVVSIALPSRVPAE